MRHVDRDAAKRLVKYFKAGIDSQGMPN